MFPGLALVLECPSCLQALLFMLWGLVVIDVIRFEQRKVPWHDLTHGLLRVKC